MLKTEKALLTAVGEKDKKAAAAAVSTKSPSKAAPKCWVVRIFKALKTDFLCSSVTKQLN